MGSNTMSEECPERRFRTLFISDVHLGARGSQADRLLDFLRGHDADTIYFVGDLVCRLLLEKKKKLASQVLQRRMYAHNVWRNLTQHVTAPRRDVLSFTEACM